MHRIVDGPLSAQEVVSLLLWVDSYTSATFIGETVLQVATDQLTPIMDDQTVEVLLQRYKLSLL